MTKTQNHPCGKCGTDPGQIHEWLCDFARCRYTGEQLIQCTWGENLAGKDVSHTEECESDLWDGEYPGKKECRKYGLYTDPDSFWGYSEDLNTLMMFSTWNYETQEYELSEEILFVLRNN